MIPKRNCGCGASILGGLSPPQLPRLASQQAEPRAKPIVSAERRQLTVMFCDLVGSTAISGPNAGAASAAIIDAAVERLNRFNSILFSSFCFFCPCNVPEGLFSRVLELALLCQGRL